MSQVPIARGLAVCENVIFEERTRNLTLVNCFTMKRAPAFPAPIRFVVAAFLADGEGDMEMAVSVQRLDTMEEVYESTRILHFPDRMLEVRFVLRIENYRFPVAGTYEINLFANGEILARQRIRLAILEDPR